MKLRDITLHNLAPVAVILVVLVCAINADAQYRPNVVVWDEKPECGDKKSVSERAEFFCSSQTVESGNVKIIETENIILKIQPHPLPGKISIRTIIENKTDKPIKTSHKEWSIAHYASEQDFLSGLPPINNERFLPPETQGGYRGSGGWSISNDPTIRLAKTVGSTSSPGYATELPAGQQQVVARPPSDSKSSSVSLSRSVTTKQPKVLDGEFNTMKLTEETVKKSGAVNGAVIFHSYETAKFRLLIIHIGETSFIFALRD